MSIQFSQGKLQEEERKTLLQQVQSHMQKVAREAVQEVVLEMMEAEVTAKLGREKGQPRQNQERVIDWTCKECKWEKCQPVHQGWPLPLRVANRLGSHSRSARADVGVSVLQA